jgi:glutaredoxin
MENNLKLFYLNYCPYCKKALSLLEILQRDNPDYAKIEVEKIEESENKQLASSYDYYLVPSFFIGKRKVFEGAMNKEDVKKVLDEYLKQNVTANN